MSLLSYQSIAYLKLMFLSTLLMSCALVDQNSQTNSDTRDTINTSEKLTIALDLSMGLVADNGATPWRTTDIKFGENPMTIALDTGTNLLWSTVSDCNTDACKVHRRVDTSQSDFQYISNPDYPKTVDFGAWGKMTVKLASIPLDIGVTNPTKVKLQFDASVDYTGSQFESLAWGGGIGFPSDTTYDDTNVESIMKLLHDSFGLSDTEFSVVTDKSSKTGKFYIGYLDQNVISGMYSFLESKTYSDPGLGYLWGTELHSARLGDIEFADLNNSVLFLDSGSSRFKAESKSIKPILDALLTYSDSKGNKIFEPYNEGGSDQPYTGVKYSNGKSPDDYSGILPDFEFALPDQCNGENTMTVFSLSPEQYSYQVETGDLKGEWVAAFHILEGIPGLLVGSTFMDLVVTQFNHLSYGAELVQGPMILYQKAKGESPSKVTCQKTTE